MPEPNKQEKVHQDIKEILEKQETDAATLHFLPPASSYYFNGFEMGVTNADLILTIKLNNQPLATLNMSFTTAKTLREAMCKTLDALESATNHDIMSIDDVKKAQPAIAEMVKAKSEDQ
jgi:hypothetical protein